MEYSAGNVSNLLWFVEMRETAKLLQNYDVKEVQRMVLDDNIYQQNTEKRAKSQFGCIKKRLDAIPKGLVKEMINADINTAKIIALIGAMATDFHIFREIKNMECSFLPEFIRNKITVNNLYQKERHQNDTIKDRNFVRGACR